MRGHAHCINDVYIPQQAGTPCTHPALLLPTRTATLPPIAGPLGLPPWCPYRPLAQYFDSCMFSAMHCLRVKVAAGEKVAEAVAELRELETDVKECERRIRFGRDFDSIMDYFASMGALRRREAELRDSLIMDLALVEKTMQEVSRGWPGVGKLPSLPFPGTDVAIVVS